MTPLGPGLALLAAGIAEVAALLVGSSRPWPGYLHLDALGYVHLALGLAMVALSFAPRAGAATARAVGLALLGVGVVGTLNGTLIGAGPLVGIRVEAVENALHLAVGAWTARAGFAD